MAGKKEIEQKEMPFVTEQIKKGAKLKRWLIKAAKTVITDFTLLSGSQKNGSIRAKSFPMPSSAPMILQRSHSAMPLVRMACLFRVMLLSQALTA